MNPYRRSISFAALTLACMLSCNGCKSNSQQASVPSTSQNPQQQAAASQPGTAAQPGTGAQAGTAPAQPAQPAPVAQYAPAPARPAPSVPAAPRQPAAVDLPAGTLIPVRLDEDLGSKISQSGDTFRATVADDVLVDGRVVIARGARAEGAVIDAKALGKIKGGAVLDIRLERVTTKWGSYPVSTRSIDRSEKGKGKRSAIMAGGGAGLGALIGGLAGGGKGAAIGAIAGGGAGTAGGAFTGNKQIVLPAETRLNFRLESPVHITR